MGGGEQGSRAGVDASRAMRSGQWDQQKVESDGGGGLDAGKDWTRTIVSLALEAESRWMAGGDGGVGDDGGEEALAVNTTVQAEAWAGNPSGRYGGGLGREAGSERA